MQSERAERAAIDPWEKSLGGKVIHQEEGRAGVGACEGRFRGGAAAFGQGIGGRADAAGAPIQDLRRQTGKE